MIFPRKPQILYAPMLATMGGGSANGFGRNTGSSLVATTFPMGHPDTGVSNYSGGSQWFSPGYLGVDIGTRYRISGGTNIGTKRLKYRATSSSNHTFFLLFWEHTGGAMASSYQQYTIRAGYRIDTPSGQTVGNVINTSSLDSQWSLTAGNFTVPAGKYYYFGWHSGSGSGNGYGDGGGLFVTDTNQPSPPNSAYNPETTISSINYSGTPSSSDPTLNQVVTMGTYHTASNVHMGLII